MKQQTMLGPWKPWNSSIHQPSLESDLVPGEKVEAVDTFSRATTPQRLPLDAASPCIRYSGSPAELAQHVRFGIEIEVDSFSQLKGNVLVQWINQIHFPPAQALLATSQQWKCERDDSIPSGSEFISPILQINDMTSLDAILQHLKHLGAKESDSTGIHIHLNALPMTVKHVLRFLHLTYSLEPMLFQMFASHSSRIGSFCRPVEDMNRFHKSHKKKKEKTNYPDPSDEPTLQEFTNPTMFPLILRNFGDVADEPALGSIHLLRFLRDSLSMKHINRFQGTNFINLFPNQLPNANTHAQTIELRYFNTILDKDIVRGMVHFAVHLQATALSEKSLDWLCEVNKESSEQDKINSLLWGIEFPCAQHQKFCSWIHNNLTKEEAPAPSVQPLSPEKRQAIEQITHHFLNLPLASWIPSYSEAR